jgi:hypothetical protein
MCHVLACHDMSFSSFPWLEFACCHLGHVHGMAVHGSAAVVHIDWGWQCINARA